MAIADYSPPAGLSISEAAQEAGLSVHTLRYYERAGLMRDPVARASSSHRRYAEADLSWITLLTRLRATGMPIRRIREYADLVRAGEHTEPQRLALLEEHRADVRAHLDEVERNLAAIDHKIDLYRERAC